MSSEKDEDEASFVGEGAGKPAQSINYGTQPLDRIMSGRGLRNHDLVAASKEGLTHKQVQKGRKGRCLTHNIQNKIANALSICTGEGYTTNHLFNYN